MIKFVKLKRIIVLTLISIFIISAFSIVYAVDIPSKVHSYFNDPAYNYETWNEDTAIEVKCWVYKVYYQQNKDGSAFIEIYYAIDTLNHTTMEGVKEWLSDKYRYSSGTFPVYSSSAPWAIIKYRKHITEGVTVISDVTDDYPLQGDETPPPTTTTKPPSNTESIEVTATPNPSASIEPSATPVVTIEPPIATPEPTSDIETTPEPTPTIEPTATPDPSMGDILRQQPRVLIYILLTLIFTFLVVLLMWAVVKYRSNVNDIQNLR